MGGLFSVRDDLGVDVVGYLLDEGESDFFHHLCLEWWEVTEDFRWARKRVS